MARGRASRATGDSGFNPALHPRDGKGRFIRTRALADAARRARGDGPTSNTGLRNAVRAAQSAPSANLRVAIKIKALPSSQRRALREKFIEHGKTPELKNKLTRALNARSRELNAQASGSTRAANRKIEKRIAAEQRRLADKAEAKAARRAEKERVAQEGRDRRGRLINRAVAGNTATASLQGFRNRIARQPITEQPGRQNSIAVRKLNAANRIVDLRGESRGRVVDKFINHGLTPALKSKLGRAEEARGREISAAYNAARRGGSAAAAGSRLNAARAAQQAPPTQPTTPRAGTLQALIRSSTMRPSMDARSYDSVNLGGSRALPGYNGSTKATLRINAAQTKQRLADRIAHLGDAEKKGIVIRQFNQTGLGNRTMQTLRNMENSRQTHLSNQTAVQQSAARAEAARQEAARHPELAALKSKLQQSPLRDIADRVNTSNVAKVKQFFDKVTPEEMDSLIKSGLPAGARNNLGYSLTGNQLVFRTVGGGISNLTRTINLEHNSVYHNYLQLRDSSQGGGLVKKVFRGLMGFYEKAGITKITVTAGLDKGGYTWNRYGFKPQEGSVALVKRRVEGMLQHLDRPDSMYKLSPQQKQLFESTIKRLGRGDRTAMWAFTDDSSALTIRSSGLPATSPGRTDIPYTIGRATMLGAGWSGIIDLNDREQRSRVYDYIGYQTTKPEWR